MIPLTTVLEGLGSGDTVGGALIHAAGSAAGSLADTGLDAIGSWVLDGTRSALEDVAGMIGKTTSPDLTGAWFSSTYWRVAGLATLLTVPFVFAAALQALLRSDLALLSRVVFGYLPLSLLAVSLAAPVTMLLLSATDQMCAVVSASALTDGARFLDQAGLVAGEVSAAGSSPFFAVVVGLLAVAAALALELELLIREAAVYVVVLMLPLAFAAFVWPARRIWAVRLVELLISLILAKFVIVAVLSLAGSAFTIGGGGVSKLLTAMALVLLSTFAPWVLLRILPFTELAAGAAGALRSELPQAGGRALALAGPEAAAATEMAADLAAAVPARLRRQADQAAQGHPRTDGAPVPATQPGEGADTDGGDAPLPATESTPPAGAEPTPPAGAEPTPPAGAESTPAAGAEPTPAAVTEPKPPAGAEPTAAPVAEAASGAVGERTAAPVVVSAPPPSDPTPPPASDPTPPPAAEPVAPPPPVPAMPISEPPAQADARRGHPLDGVEPGLRVHLGDGALWRPEE